MELSVIRQSIEVERLVGEARVQLPLKAETSVPGAGREAVEVLLEDASMSIGGVEAQAKRVVVSGSIQCQAIYRQGEDAQVRSITAQTAFEQAAEIEGVGARMNAQAEGEVEHVEAVYESGHMVFYVTVTLRVRVLNLETVEVISELQNAEAVEQRFVEVCSAKLSAEADAAALLRDEVNLPAQLNARVALMQWATPRIESAERDLGGVRVKGDVSLEALIASGVAARPVALVRYALPFDQLVELPDWLAGDAQADVAVRSTTVEVIEGGEQEDSILRLTCEALIFVRVKSQDCARALGDAYAAGAQGIAVERETISLCKGERVLEKTEPFQGALLLPEGAPAAGTVLAARVRPIVGEWHTTDEGATDVEGVIEAAVLYMPSGSDRLSAARSELPFSLRLPGALPASAWLRVSAERAEASALMSDRLELKCMIRAASDLREVEKATLAMAAAPAEAVARRAGIGICYAQPGETLWEIGKRYQVPEADLRALNGPLEQVAPGQAIIVRI